jgi:hypothetical protein
VAMRRAEDDPAQACRGPAAGRRVSSSDLLIMGVKITLVVGFLADVYIY